MPFHRILFYLLILFLPTQLGLHFWPVWSLVLGRRIDYLSPTVFFTDILLVLVLLTWFISVKRSAWSEQVNRRQRTQHWMLHGKIIALLCAVLVFAAINTIVALNWQVALYKWIKVLEFASLGYYIIRTKPRTLLVVLCLAGSVVYTSLIAIGQFAVQHSLGGPFWLLGERSFAGQTPGIARVEYCFWPVSGCKQLLRAYATLPHPNVLGGYLATVLPLIYGCTLGSLSNKQSIVVPGRFHTLRYILYSALFLGTLALVFTVSRSAWIVGALGFLLAHLGFVSNAVLNTKKQQERKRTTAIILFSIFMFFILFAYAVFALQARRESYDDRKEFISIALSLWRSSPIAGVGLGNYLVDLPYVTTERNISFLQPVHSIYLMILAESGVVGFIILICMVMLLILKMKKLRSKPHLIDSKLLPIFAIFLLGLIDHYFYTLQQAQLLVVVVVSIVLIGIPTLKQE